jgi:DNA-binding NtrC family response regulator
MDSTSLAGRSILIVEDEPLIAFDIVTAFEKAGAVALTARSLADAVRLADHDDLSAAVLDFGLADGDADAVCALGPAPHPLHPHSGYSQYSHHGPACGGGVLIPKPASPTRLIETIAGLLR